MKTHKFTSVLCAAAMWMSALPSISAAPSVHAAGGPVSYYGELQASGNQIIGAKTKAPAQVKGMSFFWSNWGGQHWNSTTVNRMVDEFKCEILRCSLGVDEYGGIYDGGDVSRLRSVLDAAIAQDVYVIVDWHSHGAHNNPDAAKNFFSEIARDYGKYDNVIFEVYNEPTQIAWSTVKSYAESVISTIRTYSDNLVLVGTPTWSQDVDQAANNQINDPNVAYVLHFYAGTHGGDLRSKGDSARNQGAPIFVSEWGTVNADGDGSVNYGSTEEWLDWMDSNQLSWCNWAISSKAEGSSIFGGDGSSLTEAGNYLKKILNAHAETAEWRHPVATTPETTTTTSTTETTTTVTTTQTQWQDTQPWENTTQWQDTSAEPQTWYTEETTTTVATTAAPQQGSNQLHKLPCTIGADAYAMMSGIEFEDCNLGGKNAGYIEEGDWLSYRIDAPKAGKYTLEFSLASESTGSSFTVSCNNQQIATVNSEATGGWQNWQTVEVDVELPAGESELRLTATGHDFNIAKIVVTSDAVALTATLCGDVDCSGLVNINDVILLSKYISEDATVTLSEQGIANSECDGQDGLTTNDITRIIMYVAKLIDHLGA